MFEKVIGSGLTHPFWRPSKICPRTCPVTRLVPVLRSRIERKIFATKQSYLGGSRARPPPQKVWDTQGAPTPQTLKPGWTCVEGVWVRRIYSTKCPVLKQNTKLRHRTPHGVRRGHPGGRPEPTGGLLSALCGVLLPFCMDLTTNAIGFLMAYAGR